MSWKCFFLGYKWVRLAGLRQGGERMKRCVCMRCGSEKVEAV